MAHYVAAVHTAWQADEALDYMADVRDFKRWDPRVHSVTLVRGEGPGLGAAYDLEVRTGPVPLTLRYEVVEWDAPNRLLLVAKTRTLKSIDEIRVRHGRGWTIGPHSTATTSPAGSWSSPGPLPASAWQPRKHLPPTGHSGNRGPERGEGHPGVRAAACGRRPRRGRLRHCRYRRPGCDPARRRGTGGTS
ncbi:MAG: SRPBCC family protein, partial [Aeromicrobium sp.]